uniref:Nicotinamide-nucleotide adenylyltransferase n=1 Tax=Glossina morsitans morsitans TaxID=37546 RepID=A0A1B0FG72_GLOMM
MRLKYFRKDFESLIKNSRQGVLAMSAFIEETTNRLLPRIVLIACGSFSPPTPMHLRMFEIAKDHFEVNGTHKVIGGIVSPTHDSYGKKGLAAAKHRCAMIKLALQSSSWIRLSDWETQQDGWSRTKSVLQYHQNFMNNYINSPDVNTTMSGDDCLPGWLPNNLRVRKDPVQLKLLCGADMLESFAVPGLWSDADIEDIVAHHGLVVITRSGANPERFIFDSDVLTKYQRNITLVTNWVPNDVSSTVIRRLLARGQSVKYLINDMNTSDKMDCFNVKLPPMIEVGSYFKFEAAYPNFSVMRLNVPRFKYYTFEALFRSEQYVLVDNACHKYLFATEFFMILAYVSKTLLASCCCRCVQIPKLQRGVCNSRRANIKTQDESPLDHSSES